MVQETQPVGRAYPHEERLDELVERVVLVEKCVDAQGEDRRYPEAPHDGRGRSRGTVEDELEPVHAAFSLGGLPGRRFCHAPAEADFGKRK